MIVGSAGDEEIHGECDVMSVVGIDIDTWGLRSSQIHMCYLHVIWTRGPLDLAKPKCDDRLSHVLT